MSRASMWFWDHRVMLCVHYGGMDSLMLWARSTCSPEPGCPPHAARIAVGAVAFRGSLFVAGSHERVWSTSWELHRSHNLKMAPPQSINAIGPPEGYQKPFLISYVRKPYQWPGIFHLTLQNAIFCPHNLFLTTQLITFQLKQKIVFFKKYFWKLNWEIKGVKNWRSLWNFWAEEFWPLWLHWPLKITKSWRMLHSSIFSAKIQIIKKSFRISLICC